MGGRKMKRALKIVSFIDVIFLLVLMLSGSLGGTASSVVYYLAFFIPVAIGFYYSRELKYEREEERGLFEAVDKYFHLGKQSLLDLLPLIAPSVLCVFLLAALTSVLLSSLGFSNPQPESRGILTMLLVHALCPAVLEELLFRYIPMKLLAPYSRRWCVIFSSMFFALIHANLFQMPYAFFAGVIFMSVNLAFDSVLPSLILHFLNNAASVVWMKYCSGSEAKIVFVSVLILLAVISLAFVFAKRDRYKSYLRSSLDVGAPEFDWRAPISLIVISMYIALSSLVL